MYLGLQVVGVFIVEPDVGVVAVGDAVGGDPVLLVSPPLGDEPSHQAGGAQVELEPLVLIGSLGTPTTAGVDVAFRRAAAVAGPVALVTASLVLSVGNLTDYFVTFCNNTALEQSSRRCPAQRGGRTIAILPPSPALLLPGK